MKRKIYLLLLMLTLSLSALNVQAADIIDGPKKFNRELIATMTEEQKQARIAEIKIRVEEIKAIDKASLSKGERKALRAELREMKKEAQAMNSNGVYLSVGAIIVIVLVLIIIL